MAKVNGLKGSSENISHEGQFFYLGRWVDKQHFRVFVYGVNGEQKLAESFNDYESLIASGLWFAIKPEAVKPEDVIKEIAPQGKRKNKNGTLCTDS